MTPTTASSPTPLVATDLPSFSSSDNAASHAVSTPVISKANEAEQEREQDLYYYYGFTEAQTIGNELGGRKGEDKLGN